MGTTTPTGQPTLQPRAPRADEVGRAWVAVLLIPVFFLLSMAVGYALYELTGYPADTGEAPLWAELVVGVASTLVFLLPCAAALIYGRRAQRSGHRRAVAPMVIGACAGLAVIVLTVVTTVASQM
jgi:MFS family permease